MQLYDKNVLERIASIRSIRDSPVSFPKASVLIAVKITSWMFLNELIEVIISLILTDLGLPRREGTIQYEQ